MELVPFVLMREHVHLLVLYTPAANQASLDYIHNNPVQRGLRRSVVTTAENMLNIARTMKDADNLDAVLNRTVKDDVLTDRECPNTRREVRTSLPHLTMPNEKLQFFVNGIHETVGRLAALTLFGDVSGGR